MNNLNEIENILDDAVDFVTENINWKLTEHDLHQYISGKLEQNNIEVSDKNLVLFNNNENTNNLSETEKFKVIRKTGKLFIRIIYKHEGSKEEKIIEKKINLKL